MPANPPTKQAARLPKPSVMYTDHNCGAWHDRTLKRDIPAALVPTRTVTEARALIRVAGFFAMGEAEQVEALAKVIAEDSRNWKGAWSKDCPETAKKSYRMDAKAVLTLIASGGAQK